MTATAQELAGLIRTLPPAEREALANDLGRIEGTGARCPATDLDTRARCELSEGHGGVHEAVARIEWMVALRCRIGMTDHGAVCAKLDEHEGECVPRPFREPPMVQERVRRERRRPRGVCPCGATRQEHEGATKTGGCERTGCRGYGKAAS